MTSRYVDTFQIQRASSRKRGAANSAGYYDSAISHRACTGRSLNPNGTSRVSWALVVFAAGR